MNAANYNWTESINRASDKPGEIQTSRREFPQADKLRGTSNTPDLVYLNNGSGNNFTQISVPSTSQGEAESVWPIDYDENGLTDFLVLNGHNEPGPVQIIAFFPVSP